MSLLRRLSSLVKFEHTIFALPFAYAGMLLAVGRKSEPGWTNYESSGFEFSFSSYQQNHPFDALSWQMVLWITIAMVAARTLAMALNRLIDAQIDARNPRTAIREIPSGAVSRTQVLGLCVVSTTVLVAATTQLHPNTRWLWPIPVAMFVIYPYTKRFTWLCHAFLGVTIGMAVGGAWLAVTGGLHFVPLVLWAAVALWVGGFDVIYAIQDIEHDRAEGLNSIPARFGVATSLRITRVAHLMTAVLLFVVGWFGDLSWAYFIGLAIVVAALAYENRIVRPNDLSRVNAAFFTMNGIVSVVYLLAVLAGLTIWL